MVHEVRKIILSLEEMQSAFDCFQRVTPDFLPKGKIIGCSTREGAVVLNVETDETHKEYFYKGVDVLKPLIRFCIENNIMLPRDGKKSFSIEQDRIVLGVELDLSHDMPSTLSPMQMGQVDKMKNDGQIPMVANGGKR